MTLILMMRLERMNAGRGDDVACIGGTTAEMNVDSRGYVNIQAAEVRSEMSVDSGGDSEDERRQRRLRFMQRRLLHWQRRLHLDPWSD